MQINLHSYYRNVLMWLILATGIFLLPSIETKAVVIAGSDPNATTMAPTDDPGWANVGKGPYSNVYLGNGWVLEAYHCHSLGGGNDYAYINGVYYPGIAGSGVHLVDPANQSPVDLYLYRINGNPGLGSLAISSVANANYTSSTIMTAIGHGLDRGTASTTWNSTWVEGGTPTAYSGYKLLATSGTKRWGQNKFDRKTTVDAGYGLGHVIQLTFDKPSTGSSLGDYEFQVAVGDSGGALFVKDSNNVWNLAGILEATGNHLNQPGATTVYGNNSYAMDLSYYRDQIVAAVQAFQFSGMLNDPALAMGSGWQSVQLIGDGGFGASTGTWTTAIDTNGHIFTVDSGSGIVSIQPGSGPATGVISGTGGLVKNGSGILKLGAANTYRGSTDLTSGTLKLSHTDALQDSTLNYSAGTLTFDGNVASHAFTFGGLSGAKALGLMDNGNNPVALTVGKNSQNTIYSGSLSGTGSLTKIGSGELTLSGALSYTGNTTVTGGILNLTSLNAPAAMVSVLGLDTTLNATSIVADTLSIGSSDGASSFTLPLASSNISAVPEPTAWMLLMMAMSGLAAMRWLFHKR